MKNQFNEAKDKLQNEAVDAWYKKINKRGTIILPTGSGKSWCIIKALYKLFSDWNTTEKPKVLFLAETDARFPNFIDDLRKYKQFTNRDAEHDFDWEFACYQSAYKWKNRNWDLVAADEVHSSLTPKYAQFYKYNHRNSPLLAVTATLKKKAKLRKGSPYTKGYLLSLIAPIVYEKYRKDVQGLGVLPELDIWLLEHRLDDEVKNIPVTTKDGTILMTESHRYHQLREKLIQAEYYKDKYHTKLYNNQLSKLLYELPSKQKVVERLLKMPQIESSPTMLFGNHIDSLEQLLPNKVVSSHISTKANQVIIDSFNNGDINKIASFKKLEQGANLSKLEYLILHSYYSGTGNGQQRLGRIRYNDNMTGKGIILVTKNTREELWVKLLLEDIESTPKHITQNDIFRQEFKFES